MYLHIVPLPHKWMSGLWAAPCRYLDAQAGLLASDFLLVISCCRHQLAGMTGARAVPGSAQSEADALDACVLALLVAHILHSLRTSAAALMQQQGSSRQLAWQHTCNM